MSTTPGQETDNTDRSSEINRSFGIVTGGYAGELDTDPSKVTEAHDQAYADMQGEGLY